MTDDARRVNDLVKAFNGLHKLPKVMTSEEILALKFPPLVWVVPGLITTGLTLLAGAPKLGKSWLALGIGFAVSIGGYVLGDIPADQGEVLYLGLEDTPRRLQSRLMKMQATGSANLRAINEWPRGRDGIAALHSWMLGNPETKIIIIDTMAKMSGVEDTNSYQETYRYTADLKKVADRFEISVVAVTHSAKTLREDFINNVIGSVGTIGAADTVIVMTRPRGSSDGILSITGRDVVEEQIGIRFDSDVGTWVMLDEVPKERKPFKKEKAKEKVDGKMKAAGEEEKDE